MPKTIEERFNRFLENNKKETKKYNETHRDLINEKCRIYYHAKIATNEEYKQKKRDYNKQRYLKLKEAKKVILVSNEESI